MMTEPRTTSLPLTEPSQENGTNNNGTDFETDDVAIAIIGVSVIICLFGLVGNGIVLWFVGFRIKRNPFTVYVINLAAADFGFLLCLPLHFTIYIFWNLFLFDIDILYSAIILINLFLFMNSTSLYLLTAISVERCVSVLFPIWHRCCRPKHLSAIICALLWTLSCLLTGVGLFQCLLDSYIHCKLKVIQLTATNFLIFTPIMVLSSLILIVKVHLSSQKRQPGRLYIVILLNILFFLFFAVPLSIFIFLLNLGYHFEFNPTPILLASLNSSINPIIYFFVGSYRNRQFRGSVKKALQQVFEDEERVSDSASYIPKATNLEDPIGAGGFSRK